MDQSDLVINIVLNLDETFQNLSLDECKNIFGVFPSFSYLLLNKNIKEALHKYLSEYIYDQLFEHIKNTSYFVLLGYHNRQSYIAENKIFIDTIMALVNNYEVHMKLENIITSKSEMLYKYDYDDSCYNLYHSYNANNYELDIINLMNEMIKNIQQGR